MRLARRRRQRQGLLAPLLALLVAGTSASCGGSGGASAGPGSTPTPGATPAPTSSPDPVTTATLDLLRLAPEFSYFEAPPDADPIVLSRDGTVVASAQQDYEVFYYPDPDFPEFLRMGVIFCSRALAWRDAAPAETLDPDPGCPFPDDDRPAGDSWPAALSADGGVALVNRTQNFGQDYRADFGFTGADGSWEEVVWDVHHPDQPRTPRVRTNDMSGDGTLVVGTAWLDYPYPGWAPSDARAFVFRRGDAAPTWLPDHGERIESADHVSDDGRVIVGCCDHGRDRDRSLPVLWYDHGAPVSLDPPNGETRCAVGDLSADGRVVVGSCDGHAVRWVDGVPQPLEVPGEPPPGATLMSWATDVSEDGSTILAASNAVDYPSGWLWSAETGPRSVRTLLEDAGIVVDEGGIGGRILGTPLAFARNGKVFVGFGERGVGPSHLPFVYRVTLP